MIALWELEAKQVLGFDNPALLPFIPLMRGGDTEQIVRQCAERIRQEAGETELEAILSVFAGYVLDTEIAKQILRWEMAIVKESPIIQELLTQERQLGFGEMEEAEGTFDPPKGCVYPSYLYAPPLYRTVIQSCFQIWNYC